MGNSASNTERPLTPQNLLDDFGVRTAVTRESVRTLLEALGGDDARRLFALQTYYATLVKLLAERFGYDNVDDLPSGNPFAWCMSDGSKTVGHWIDQLRETIAGYRLTPAATDGECDLFKPLYQNLFPRTLRHRLGEYYTPDWLAEHVLDEVGYTGQPGQRLLDPTCGSGTFLLLALRRARRNRREKGDSPIFAETKTETVPHAPLMGFDLNPLAVMTARANYLIAMADLPPHERPTEAPIYLRDAILGDAAESERFDFVVGNPPWIAWDNLPDADRQATRPLWERYGLFSLSGSDARHGGAKKDLSMLVLYATADRYLKSNGRLGMVVSQTLFQTRGAGDGFRRFRLGEDRPPLQVLRVDDLTALRPFAGAASRTGVIVLQKGDATVYPVPYFVWKGEGEREKEECLAHPIDPARPTSPWHIEKRGQNCFSVSNTKNSSDPFYSAHLGANSGGANGVYWVEVLGEQQGGVLVRNMATRGKRTVEAVEQVIEPDLLYPLLRWGDVARYRAAPSSHILLTQDTNTRTGIDEERMRRQFPRTLAYLERFHDLLLSRAAYRRYQGRGPFYSMYNVGPYTVAPIKVVWRRMDRQLNAAVVESLVVPQETCVLVACDSADEAHYLCAMLNSDIVNQRVAAHSVRGSKGFGTPGMLEYLPLDRYLANDPRHIKLATLSRQAHAAASMPEDRGTDKVAKLQGDIDELAGRLWDS